MFLKEEKTEKKEEERKEDQQRVFLKEETNTNDKEPSEANWRSSAIKNEMKRSIR